MTLGPLLAELREKNIALTYDGTNLKCVAAPGGLTPELRAKISQRKGDLVEFLMQADAAGARSEAVVPLNPSGIGPAIYGVPGHNGDPFCFKEIAYQLRSEHAFFALQPPGLFGDKQPLQTVEEMARYFASEIGTLPSRPFVIVGYCAGGSVAFELARLLVGAGAPVLGLALFGSPYPTFFKPVRRLLWRVTDRMDQLRREGWKDSIARISGTLRAWRDPPVRSKEDEDLQTRRAAVERATLRAIRRFKPGHFAGPTALLFPCRRWAEGRYLAKAWSEHATSCVEYYGPDGCDNFGMLLQPYVGEFARLLKEAINSIQSGRMTPTRTSERS